jgi:hypothetical protein
LSDAQSLLFFTLLGVAAETTRLPASKMLNPIA